MSEPTPQTLTNYDPWDDPPSIQFPIGNSHKIFIQSPYSYAFPSCSLKDHRQLRPCQCTPRSPSPAPAVPTCRAASCARGAPCAGDVGCGGGEAPGVRLETSGAMKGWWDGDIGGWICLNLRCIYIYLFIYLYLYFTYIIYLNIYIYIYLFISIFYIYHIPKYIYIYIYLFIESLGWWDGMRLEYQLCISLYQVYIASKTMWDSQEILGDARLSWELFGLVLVYSTQS